MRSRSAWKLTVFVVPFFAAIVGCLVLSLELAALVIQEVGRQRGSEAIPLPVVVDGPADAEVRRSTWCPTPQMRSEGGRMELEELLSRLRHIRVKADELDEYLEDEELLDRIEEVQLLVVDLICDAELKGTPIRRQAEVANGKED